MTLLLPFWVICISIAEFIGCDTFKEFKHNVSTVGVDFIKFMYSF